MFPYHSVTDLFGLYPRRPANLRHKRLEVCDEGNYKKDSKSRSPTVWLFFGECIKIKKKNW
jgi:hypothetical protein